MTAIPRRGEVWLAEVDKTRPVIVLTRNPMARRRPRGVGHRASGRYLDAVLVAPVTSTVRDVSTEVPVGPADGIRVESVANLDNAQLLARARLVRRVGHATPDTMARLCDALAIAVDCAPH